MKGDGAFGLVETVGLVAAIEAADAGSKAADVKIIGYEMARGGGLTTIKFAGDVAAVKAAVDAAKAAAERVGRVYAVHVISRPADQIRPLFGGNIEKEKEGGEPGETAGSSERESHEDIPGSSESSCNICKDPACPRKKGEPRSYCIHYKKR
ncbi:BMC domain-containing protein [Thermosediminibacter oceani]|uniref:Microcompartments protein n=1 Tax=Thermosediminibacter oceani (strain ATCC BAA-1034 / DSM 16646 / JW/IW-1228P) TaxID=555079 RepID=D9S1Q0_THEOJ|nr:microcompartments protein [Thermosediminibacter oceani DSM 16646]